MSRRMVADGNRRTGGHTDRAVRVFLPGYPYVDTAQQARNNADRIKKELTSLRRDHLLEGSTPISPHRYKLGDFFAHWVRIERMLKNLQLPEEERKPLEQEHQSLYEEVNSIKERFGAATSKNSKELEGMLNALHIMIQNANDERSMHEAAEEKDRIFALFKNKPYRLNYTDRERHWAIFETLRGKLDEKRDAMQSDNVSEAEKVAAACMDEASNGRDPYNALQKIQEAQQSLTDSYMSAEQRRPIRDKLNLAWKEAMARTERTWREKMKKDIERWKENIKSSEESIRSIQASLDRMKEQKGNAQDGRVAEQLRRYNLEAEQKIDARQHSIGRWKNMIKDAEAKLEKLNTVTMERSGPG